MTQRETVSWYWHRLRAMRPAEIASRVAEKTRALAGRGPALVPEDFQLGPAHPGTMLLPERGAAPQAVRDQVAREAAALRAGRWRLFGWKEIAMPEPPAWDWDALHDARAPLTGNSHEINHRRLPGGADSRCVWETNRWAEPVSLAQNAWLNGELEDARLAQRWIEDWCARNAPGQGIHWCSPLEAALRLLNFCWLDSLLRDCGDAEIAAAQTRLAERVVPAHVAWIWRHRSFGSSANNHLIGELAALVVAARRWPCLMRLACCAEKAWQLLEDEVLRQFAEDGGNREQALHYHLFAWELAWQARRVMGGGGAEFEQRMKEAAQYFAALVHPEEPWDFGDSDDAQVTPLMGDRAAAAREWQGWLTGGPAGETLRYWLGAPPVVTEHAPEDWLLFENSGQAVRRRGAWMARFDASPLGFGSMAAHGHLDALHVSLWLGDKAVIIDPGTGAYYADAVLRAELAGWEAHNGPLPEAGRRAPRRTGTFLWTEHHEPPRLRLEDGDAVACLACDGPFVKRRVRLDDGSFEAHDSICNDLPHRLTWTLAPGWEIQMTGSAQRYRLAHPDGSRLLMQFESGGLLEVEPVRVRVSPRFLQVQEAAALRVRFAGALKTRVKPG